MRPSPLPFRACAALSLLAVCLASAPAVAQKLPDVVVTGAPVAPSPNSEVGTGLCMASNVWTRAVSEYPQSQTNYTGDLNTYMEENRATRQTSVLRSAFDLSNNLNDGRTLSYGDFVNVVTGCPIGGCGFHYNTPTVRFVSRFRGYLNVTPDMLGRVLHFGFYADDAISLVIFDRSNARYNVIIRPPELGAATRRTTNSVTFTQSGLYPVELIYVQIVEHAALEFAVLDGTFTDFDEPANQPPVVPLSSSGFSLVQPAQFYQSENGRPSYPGNLNQCEQCNRNDANAQNNSTCGPYYYCNSAALCAPCDSALFCGASCSPCGLSTPYCANLNGQTACVQCTEDSQCPNGRCDLTDNFCRGCNDNADCPTGRCDLTDNSCKGCVNDAQCGSGQVCDEPTFTCVQCTGDENCPNGQVCDPTSNTCSECNQDTDCARGEQCSNHVCVLCDANDACAGNSCNCCPNGTQCAAPTPGAPPSCVECTTDSQCSNGQRCDTVNGACVDAVPECNTADRCGPGCSKCPGERPFCLDGEVCVQCRTDLECGDGQFCLSGECSACTTDERCGSRCGACGDATPLCLTDGSVQNSVCVGCVNDSDCGSGTCDPTTRTCSNTGACAMTCAEGLVCDGAACVECFADAHCPCGGTCDLASSTCSESCADSGDCLGVEFCSAETLQCERGRRKPGTEPQGGAFCCGTTAEDTPTGSTAILVTLALGFLFLRSARRVR
ncbi:outer membrane exchange protein TraA family protein [Corallococcus sp. CA047B]|uniref:outer membrane exchange protein TraA family protein n=1 Tax=Corallococcus sp. CA047B TaxID=2316729 RepID=UPI001F37E517|nr:outer membrane exchange protein TraA family protein [Corallococcus sp. CA047B]